MIIFISITAWLIIGFIGICISQKNEKKLLIWPVLIMSLFGVINILVLLFENITDEFKNPFYKDEPKQRSNSKNS